MNRFYLLIIVVFILSLICLLPGHVNAFYYKDYVPGEILVKFSPDLSTAQEKGLLAKDYPALEALNKRFSATSIKRIYPKLAVNSFSGFMDTSSIYKIRFSRKTDVQEAVKSYSALSGVLFVQPNYILYASEVTPNDPEYTTQKAYLQTMSVPQGWAVETGNSSVIIAIVDSGTDWNHSDLAGNMWVNPADPWNNPNVWNPDNNNHNGNGIDDDNNGFIDDYRGWDFVDVSPSLVYPGEDDDPADANPDDFSGHGTFVSSQADAVGNNNIGVTGIAWNCKIMSVRAGYQPKSGTAAVFTVDAVIGAINYAVDNGAHVINMSFGVQGTPEEYPLITSVVTGAIQKGVVLVAAAGNSGISGSDFPANIPGVISVGSVDTNGERSYFSNYGSDVDVYATGNTVTGAYPEGIHSQTGALPYTTRTGKKTYDIGSGTSYSTPLVSGLTALIISKDPSLSAEKVINQLINYSDTITNVKRINVYRSLTEGDLAKGSISYNLSPGWNLISFPFLNVISVSGFNGSFYYVEGGNVEEIQLKIDGGLAKEIELSSLNQLEPGKAYWTRSNSVTTASAEGTSLSSSSFNTSFQGQGLKPLGNPFSPDIPWGKNNVTLENGKDLSYADSQGVLLSTIYYYDTAKQIFTPLQYEGGNIVSGRGYYILNHATTSIVFKK
ncbi:MAG TPA: S8 family serine peptidase [Candidatus Eremiobacteraeota bacterium]|nr:MAG: Thermophilic serine proteinase precursor [bacterium ADurb.Bin363]HPZ06786.1 S8 family serine peptidase [Candidatus Eremiobacteraeota bacterium]